MRLFALTCVVTAACASDEPSLERIEPAQVTSLVATPATVSGSNLGAVASIDLDSETPAGLDRGWRLRAGTQDLADVAWRDRGSIDVVIPAGLTAGTYDITAISPTGRELTLRDALTVTADPIGLVLAIESAPGGTGSTVGAQLAAGDTLHAHAVVRDRDGRFVADTHVDWELTDAIGTLASADSATTLTATTVGVGRLHAHHAGANLDATSGDIDVRAGLAAQLRIVDTNGATIANVAGLTTDVDGGLSARATTSDAFGNATGDVSVVWSVSGVSANPIATGSTAAVDFTTPGTGMLIATHASLGTAMTGDLIVAPGRAAALGVSPASITLTADAAPLTFSATGTDADGNATTNLGVLSWSVASGPITALNAAGTLDPVRAGTGTVRVTSSYGPNATSGPITISAGAAATVTVSPPALNTDADAAPTAFTATASDADGNVVTRPVTWSVASGPIGELAADGTLDPMTAGSGAISATVDSATGSAPVTIAPGRAQVLTTSPDTADIPQGGSPLPFTVTGTDQDGNATTNLGIVTWSVATGAIATLDASGVLTPQVPGSGRIRATSSYGVFDETQAIVIRRRATLSASLAITSPLSLGGRTNVRLTVTNTGEGAAMNVLPCALTLTSGFALVSGATPASVAMLSPGASTTFTWQVDANAIGSQQATSCADATDAPTSAPVASGNASAGILVLLPVFLAVNVSMPSLVGRGNAFAITLDITNTGEATANTPVPALSFMGPGVTLVGSPGPIGPLAGGAATQVTFVYRATAQGTLQVSGSAQAVDAGNGQTVTSSPATDTTDVVESVAVATDPFGDGSQFGFVTAYSNAIVIGPNRTGRTVASFTQGGVPVGPPQTFLFARDTTGNSHANTSTPYRSLGVAGCVANTAACGPDNENGRGTLTGVTLGGVEWLVAMSARDNKGSEYLYMTTDTDANLDFRYVDLKDQTPGETFGSSALFALGGRLYIGEFGKGGAGPVLLALLTTPNAPGLDATSAQMLDLDAKNMPGLQTGVTSHDKIDTMHAFGGLLYLANPGGWVRATVPVPRSFGSNATDWASMTPTSAAYTARTSHFTTKLFDLEPADRAVPQMATFGGRVFVGRNTTVGPQLWSCNPSTSGSATQCDAGDWQLVAPNLTGDTLLTQFDTNLTSISMVTATAEFLYVGFDSPTGVRVMRTANPAASTQADFERDFGGAGLGDAANTRILDGKALTAGGTTAVWITVAGAGPLTLVMLP
jgi:hypothetical protein